MAKYKAPTHPDWEPPEGFSIPDGFEDYSYRNDEYPSFGNPSLRCVVWVATKDYQRACMSPAYAVTMADEELKVYHLHTEILDSDGSLAYERMNDDDMFRTDNLDELLAEIAKIKPDDHNCHDFVEHRFDEESNLGDYYVCAKCGELLQVG